MTEDLYPSRVDVYSRLIDRQEPVVYSDWTRDAPLSAEQVVAYERDGYLVLKDIFTPAEIKTLQGEAFRLRTSPEMLEAETAIAEPGENNRAVRSVFRIHRQSEIFSRLAADARLVRVAQFLLNDEVYIHQSRLNYKPGFEGREFYWHSDFETWHVEDGMPRMRALSASVLLTENVPANGPTMFMPGSHWQYATCIGETPDDHYKESLRKQEYVVPDYETLTRLAQNGIDVPTGPAGTVVLFDCNTMHGSNSNITPLPRSNAFFCFNALSNRLEAPFGPDRPRPEFIATREAVNVIKPAYRRLEKTAA